MPRFKYEGNSNINSNSDDACHVFALSGDNSKARDINDRYNLLGNSIRDAKSLLNNDQVIEGLNHVTNNTIRNIFMQDEFQATDALKLICIEFDLLPKTDTGNKIYGHFKPGQIFPEHMYITCSGKIYDTMPESPIRMDNDINGLNAPAYVNPKKNVNPYDKNGLSLSFHLTPNVVAFIEVDNFAKCTLDIINSSEWSPTEGILNCNSFDSLV